MAATWRQARIGVLMSRTQSPPKRAATEGPGSPGPVPAGTGSRRSETACERSGRRRRAPAELLFVHPHAVEDNRQLPGDLGFAWADPLGQRLAPLLEPGRLREAAQHNVGRFEQVAAQQAI